MIKWNAPQKVDSLGVPPPKKVDCLISEDLCHDKSWNGQGCCLPLAFLDIEKFYCIP